MSLWTCVDEQEDVSLSEDKQELHVRYGNDENGSLWLYIPIEIVKEAMKDVDDNN